MENPFFLLETRRLGRDRALRTYLGLGVAGVLCALAGWWMRRALALPPPPGRLPFEAHSLVWAHSLACLLAGCYAADRVLAREHRAGTLEQLRLLPWTPLAWVGARLVYPLYVLGLAWLAGVPVYVAAAASGMAPFSPLMERAALPLWVGLGALLVALAHPVEFMSRPSASGESGGSPRRTANPVDSALPLALLVTATAVVMKSLLPGKPFEWPRVCPFYGVPVPGWSIWAGLGALMAAAALLTTLDGIAGTPATFRRAVRIRGAAAALVWYVDVGLFWGVVPFWARIGLLLLPLAFRALLTPRRGRREDAGARREAAWIRTRFEAPLLVRDLQGATRFRSLRRSFLGNASAVLIWTALALFVALRMDPLFAVVMDMMALGYGVGIGVVLVLILGSQATLPWARERTANTLPLLLLTPLDSRELLRQRLGATLIHAAATVGPFLVWPLLSLAWGVGRGHWICAPLAVAVAPLLLLGAVGARPQEAVLQKEPRIEVTGTMLALAMGAAEGTGCVLVYGVSPVGAWLLAGLCAAGNALLLRWTFHERARQLEALRRGE